MSLNFVLVHGAWHKNTCWLELKKFLEPHGCVYMPSLIQNNPTCLNDYLSILKKTIDAIDTPVILIGHSFAGFIITQYASQFPKNIQELIYINAFIPKHQESMFSLSANFSYQNLNPFLQVNDAQHTLSIQPIHKIHEWMYQCSPAYQVPISNFRPEPLGPLLEKIEIEHPIIHPAKAIISQYDLVLSPQDQIHMCDRQQIVYHLIEADHCPFQSAPKPLSQLILKGI